MDDDQITIKEEMKREMDDYFFFERIIDSEDSENLLSTKTSEQGSVESIYQNDALTVIEHKKTKQSPDKNETIKNHQVTSEIKEEPLYTISTEQPGSLRGIFMCYLCNSKATTQKKLWEHYELVHFRSSGFIDNVSDAHLGINNEKSAECGTRARYGGSALKSLNGTFFQNSKGDINVRKHKCQTQIAIKPPDVDHNPPATATNCNPQKSPLQNTVKDNLNISQSSKYSATLLNKNSEKDITTFEHDPKNNNVITKNNNESVSLISNLNLTRNQDAVEIVYKNKEIGFETTNTTSDKESACMISNVNLSKKVDAVEIVYMNDEIGFEVIENLDSTQNTQVSTTTSDKESACMISNVNISKKVDAVEIVYMNDEIGFEVIENLDSTQNTQVSTTTSSKESACLISNVNISKKVDAVEIVYRNEETSFEVIENLDTTQNTEIATATSKDRSICVISNVRIDNKVSKDAGNFHNGAISQIEPVSVEIVYKNDEIGFEIVKFVDREPFIL